MTNKTNSKGSARKKLIPAVGMLTVSAMMLSSATYAWFTMAREVEVTNIQMTASVPEDLQISLGMLGGFTNTGDESHGLVDNYGFLVKAANGTSADNGGVAAPSSDAIHWSNTADISAYYALGKIMPASSTDGKNIYFTPDASGVGKTIKDGAKYYKAAEQATIFDDDFGHAYMTTLHAYNSTEKASGSPSIAVSNWADGTTGAGKYVKASGWDDTNDDGYFVDIPIWIRSSSSDNIPLSVDAYVTTKNKTDEDDLYLAARAVILNDAKSDSSGLIEIRKDGYDGTDSIVNFMSSTNATGAAVASVDANNKATYGAETHYDGTTGKSQVNVPAGNGEGNYGTPTKVWIRVWLEGEDPNCWNENAGQDFNISLKFTREDVELPTTYPFSASASADATSTLTVGTRTTITFPDNTTTNTYSYNGSGWTNMSTFPAASLGKYYKIGDTMILDEAGLAKYIKDNVKTTAQAESGLKLTEATITAGMTVALPEQLTITDGTWNTDPDGSATGFVVQETGVSYTTAADVLTACSSGTYHVTVTYVAGVSTYAVSYDSITVTDAVVATSGDTSLKLMKITIKDNSDPDNVATSYQWFVAPDNAYTLPGGAKLTSNLTSTTQYDDLGALLADINATADNGTISTITEVAVPDTKEYTISIQNAPNGESVTLVKTVNRGTVSWAEKSGDGYTAFDADSLTKNSKLNFANGAGYTTVAALCSAWSTNAAAPQIVWEYNYVGTFTATKGAEHYSFTSTDATFPTDFSAYQFQINGTGEFATYANLAALETALNTANATSVKTQPTPSPAP